MNTLALINFDLIKRATESGPDIKPVGTLVTFRVSLPHLTWLRPP